MRLFVLVVVAVATLVLLGCGGGSRSADRSRVACDPALERGLREWAQAGFSGSIAITTRGRLDCAVAYGTADRATGRPNSPGTVFSIGSITKATTAAAIFDLAEEGRLSLSDRAGSLLPSLRGPAARATVRQLMLHTSGLVGSHGNDSEPLGRDEALAAIGRLEVAFPPGSDFAYSNAGYTLLALIVEHVSGTTYRDYVASHVLRLPGGRVVGGFWNGSPAARAPRAAGYLDDGSPGERGSFAGPFWAVEGNGGVAMTMPALAEWSDALFGGRLVSRRATKAITTPGFRHGGGRSETPGWVLYDASVFGQSVFASAGGGGDVGHTAVVAWLPESRRAIAIASNTPDVSAERLLQRIGPALAAGRKPPPPRRPAGAGNPAAHAGTYALPRGSSLVVRARGARLEVSARGAAAVAALFPSTPGFSAVEVAAHERAVLALLAGRTAEGRKERAALESAVGRVDRVAVEGTVVADGELRTYVVASSGRRSVLLWYALTDQRSVAAAEAPTRPPTLVLAGAGRFQPDDPTGRVSVPTVTFARSRMTLTWPGGAATAERRSK